MRLSRRNFFEGALSGGAYLALGAGPLRQLAFAASPGAQTVSSWCCICAGLATGSTSCAPQTTRI